MRICNALIFRIFIEINLFEASYMMAMRSDNASASSMKWVVNMIVRFVLYFCINCHNDRFKTNKIHQLIKSRFLQFLIWNLNSHSLTLLNGSRPEVGSSRIIICESPIRAMPTDRRRRMPPESCLDRFCKSCLRPIRAAMRFISCSKFCLENPFIDAISSKCS